MSTPSKGGAHQDYVATAVPPDPPQLAKSEPPRPLRQGKVACSQCLEDMSAEATTCPHCQATRRSTKSGKWTSYREGRRNDIVIAAICLWLLSVAAFMIVGMFLSASGAFKSNDRTTVTTACTSTLRSYGLC